VKAAHNVKALKKVKEQGTAPVNFGGSRQVSFRSFTCN